MKKREFLTQMSILSAGLLVLPSIGCIAKEKSIPFGIQLYSLRDQLKSGVENVISEVAKAGYHFVEAYGYSAIDGFWGLTPAQFKALLDKYELTCPSAHYDFGAYQQSGSVEIIKDYIRTAKILGSEYIVIPYMNPDIYKNEQLTKAWILQVNTAAQLIKDAGLKLAYHNHDIEFFDLGNGKNAFEMLLNGTQPDLVDFEMDVYWVVKAKKDPLKLFNTYPGRFKLWHIKDMSKADEGKNTEIGNGTVDYPAILKEAKKAGLQFPIMEQENYEMDAYESINISAKYLQKIL